MGLVCLNAHLSILSNIEEGKHATFCVLVCRHTNVLLYICYLFWLKKKQDFLHGIIQFGLVCSLLFLLALNTVELMP